MRLRVKDMTFMGTNVGDLADTVSDMVLGVEELRVIPPNQYAYLYACGGWDEGENAFCRNLRGLIRSGELPYVIYEGEGRVKVFVEYGGARAVMREYEVKEHQLIRAILQEDENAIEPGRLPAYLSARAAAACGTLVGELVDLHLNQGGSVCDLDYRVHAWVSPTTGREVRVILSAHNLRLETLRALPGWCGEVVWPPVVSEPGYVVVDSIDRSEALHRVLLELSNLVRMFPEVEVGACVVTHKVHSGADESSWSDLRHCSLVTREMLSYMRSTRGVMPVSRTIYYSLDDKLIVLADQQHADELIRLLRKARSTAEPA